MEIGHDYQGLFMFLLKGEGEESKVNFKEVQERCCLKSGVATCQGYDGGRVGPLPPPTS